MDFQFNPNGMTALMLAAANGHLDCVKLLVNYSASLDKKCPQVGKEIFALRCMSSLTDSLSPCRSGENSSRLCRTAKKT